MLKEYIEKQIEENQITLSNLEREMKILVKTLEEEKNSYCEVQKKTVRDVDIFSPRSVLERNDEKSDERKTKIDDLNNKIESIRESIEYHLNKQQEYHEIIKQNEQEERSKISSGEEIEIGQPKNKIMAHDLSCKIDEGESTKESGICLAKDVCTGIEYDEIVEKMKEVFHSTEICLAFLNGNKNKCKNELNQMKKNIKEVIELLEKRKNE